MHLRSISMKGFKSFPDRTKLEFGTGVSVVVGPNGSGKSNITDAVLWALGEQSPLAVRGQVMKDVIFAGGHGVQGSSSAEVEVVIDNGDGRLPTDFSEISILRRLNRDGEGEYRLNGARCRLVDVIEVLSDSGLGKEMHSVVSQGKVEQIVMSRPRERRLLIEEAAGLGKHRKRRRRAQLKLERTQDNLGRALDVEREARSRLRPLKRQAEAAELHERLERQTFEARYALARDAAREARESLSGAEQRARAARTERDEAERLLGEVATRREQAETAFAEQTRERERIQAGLYAARSAAERIAMRLERVREQGAAALERRARRVRELELLEAEAARDTPAEAGSLPAERLPRPPEEDGGSTRAAWDALAPADRIRSLEREVERLETDRQARLREEVASLEAELERARAEQSRLQQAAAAARAALGRHRQGDRARPRRAPRRRARGRGGPRPRRPGGRRARGRQPVPAHRRIGARRLDDARRLARRGARLRAGAGGGARQPRCPPPWSPTCPPASACWTAPATRAAPPSWPMPGGPRRAVARARGRRAHARPRQARARRRGGRRAPARARLGGRLARRPAQRLRRPRGHPQRAALRSAPAASCPRRRPAAPSACSRSAAAATT